MMLNNYRSNFVIYVLISRQAHTRSGGGAVRAYTSVTEMIMFGALF